jgi:hypothetical protein
VAGDLYDPEPMHLRRRIFLVLVATAVVAGCSKGDAGRKGGAIAKAGDISVFDVRVGDCLMPGDELGAEIADIRAVPCREPHTHEVFALPEYEDTDVYPGEDKLRTFADAQCLEAFGNYTGTDYLESKLFFSYLQPSVRSWNDGKDRRIVCVIVATGKPVKGSVRSTSATTTSGGSGSTKSPAQRRIESKAKAEAEQKAREKAGLGHTG